MLCQTMKQGHDCGFMTARGCSYGEPRDSGGRECEPVIDACEGCVRIHEFDSVKYCNSFASPEQKWRLGTCNFATHKRVERLTKDPKINPLKASRRAARGT